MEEKYRVVILYTYYDNYINSIKAEEMKGNIEVVCVGTDAPQWKSIDGWLMTDVQSALLSRWNFLIYAGAEEGYLEILGMLQSLSFVTCDNVLPVNIFAIPRFDFKDYIRLNQGHISIISNHCWGGFTYHYLHMQFYSPFINMYVIEDEYLKLLENLENYMRLEVEYVGEEYETDLKRNSPIGKIGDVHLHFNHYISFEEAKQKWEERKNRMNMNNLFVQMTTSSRENAQRFDSLPYKNKAVFVPTSFGLESEINLNYFSDMIDGDGTRVWENVNALAAGNIDYFYNVIKLLNGEKDFLIFN